MCYITHPSVKNEYNAAHMIISCSCMSETIQEVYINMYVHTKFGIRILLYACMQQIFLFVYGWQEHIQQVYKVSRAKHHHVKNI